MAAVYDAIIVGAGPAGLALGSELSKNHKILIIDKNGIGDTTKIWTTEKKIVDDNKLKQFVSTSFKKGYFKSFNTKKHFVYADFVTLNEKALLKHYKEAVLSNKSDVKSNCEFLSIKKRGKKGLTIETSKGPLSCRLLVDCSGAFSKLGKRYGVWGEHIYYITYGEVYRLKLEEDEVCIMDSMMNKSPIPSFEVLPVSKKECVFYTFEYVRRPVNEFRLKKFQRTNIEEGYLKDKLRGKKPIREVYGTTPIGHMKKHAVGNVIFFGDSSLISPWFGAGGFTNIMMHYKKFAGHISKNLTNDTLTEDDLDYKYSEIEEINREMGFILASITSNAKPATRDLLYDALGALPSKIFLDAALSRLTPSDMLLTVETLIKKMGLVELIKLIPPEKYPLMIKQISEASEEFTVNELEKLFHKHGEYI